MQNFLPLETKEIISNDEKGLFIKSSGFKFKLKDSNLSFNSSSSFSLSSSVSSSDSSSSISLGVLPKERIKSNKKKLNIKHSTLFETNNCHLQNNYVETNELNFIDMNLSNREKVNSFENDLQFEQESLIINSQNHSGIGLNLKLLSLLTK